MIPTTILPPNRAAARLRRSERAAVNLFRGISSVSVSYMTWAEEEEHCSTCQQDLRLIGEESSERYEYIPAELTVIEDICKKYACDCTVKTATKPAQPIQKSTAGASLLAFLFGPHRLSNGVILLHGRSPFDCTLSAFLIGSASHPAEGPAFSFHLNQRSTRRGQSRNITSAWRHDRRIWCRALTFKRPTEIREAIWSALVSSGSASPQMPSTRK